MEVRHEDEEAVTSVLKGGASQLGSHAFLDEFALAYATGRSLTACAPSPRPCWSMPAVTSTGGRRAIPLSRATFSSLEAWRRILDEANVGRLVETIADASDERQLLRSFSPFVGALSPEERLKILTTGCEGQS